MVYNLGMSKRRFRPPYLQLSPEARTQLLTLVRSEELLEAIRRVVEVYVDPKVASIRPPKSQLEPLKATVDSLVNRLETLAAYGWTWGEDGRTFAINVTNASLAERSRISSKICDLSESPASQPRPTRPGSRGIPYEQDGTLYWIEMPLSELKRFADDLDWLLDSIQSRGGRPRELARQEQATAVARVLREHRIHPTKHRRGRFAKILRIVLPAAGYVLPEDLLPILKTAVDQLRHSTP